jgi:hypothetical protein
VTVEIGILLGELKQFKDETKHRHDELKCELKILAERVGELNTLRWRIAGGVAAVTSFVAGVVGLVHFIKVLR